MGNTAQETFIEMVNGKNPDLGLTIDDVDFGSPTAHTTSVEGDTRNTALVLTAKPESAKFKGSKEYHYFRFDLTHPNGEDVYSLATNETQSNFTNDAFVLSIFNANLPNYFLTLGDVTILHKEPITDANDLVCYDVKITIKPGHLKYLGIWVVRFIDEGKANLFWANGELNGFS